MQAGKDEQPPLASKHEETLPLTSGTKLQPQGAGQVSGKHGLAHVPLARQTSPGPHSGSTQHNPVARQVDVALQ